MHGHQSSVQYVVFFILLQQNSSKNKSTSVDVGLIWSQEVGVLSLQRWQSYRGLILVEKEETLAASSRLHWTFVSKCIKTEMEKKGVGKAEGEDEKGKQNADIQCEARETFLQCKKVHLDSCLKDIS